MAWPEKRLGVEQSGAVSRCENSVRKTPKPTNPEAMIFVLLRGSARTSAPIPNVIIGMSAVNAAPDEAPRYSVDFVNANTERGSDAQTQHDK